jgi:hypothetical protein
MPYIPNQQPGAALAAGNDPSAVNSSYNATAYNTGDVGLNAYNQGLGYGSGQQWGNQNRKLNPTQLMQEERNYAGLAGGDRASQEAARQMQMQQAAALQQTAAGNGPSVATGMMQQNNAMAQQNAMAAARMATGNPAEQAAAYRNASTNAALATNNISAQIGQVKAGEMLGAQGQLTGLYGGLRGQDLQQQQMAQQAQMGFLNAGMTAEQQEQSNALALANLNSANYNSAQGLNQATATGNAQGAQAMANLDFQRTKAIADTINSGARGLATAGMGG